MSNKNRHTKISTQTQDEALKVAKATQRPGQTKEQTKLIAHGIEKGIQHYKKQQKAKSRTLNKKSHQFDKIIENQFKIDSHSFESGADCKRPILPWVLIIFSWIGFAVFYFKNIWY